MRFATLLLCGLLVVVSLGMAQDRPIVIQAGSLLDGKGGVAHNTVIQVEGGRSARVGPGAAAGAGATYDLKGLTILPGLIDTHVHLDWHFGLDGRYATRDPASLTMACAIERPRKSQPVTNGAEGSAAQIAAESATAITIQPTRTRGDDLRAFSGRHQPLTQGVDPLERCGQRVQDFVPDGPWT